MPYQLVTSRPWLMVERTLALERLPGLCVMLTDVWTVCCRDYTRLSLPLHHCSLPTAIRSFQLSRFDIFLQYLQLLRHALIHLSNGPWLISTISCTLLTWLESAAPCRNYIPYSGLPYNVGAPGELYGSQSCTRTYNNWYVRVCRAPGSPWHSIGWVLIPSR